uniref:Peptidase S8/S53 domain-containing protein n=1 Tax=Ananas comosus var. bracteatus TaxID=296719 RepID=A0A6V7PPJ5_ANACO|nr:unnamed protein product [Ananas comosus var. bracteatus]
MVDRQFSAVVTLGNGRTLTGLSLYPENAWIQNRSLVYNRTISACNSTADLSALDGAVVVCHDTGSLFDQVEAVGQSTVGGAIFLSNESYSGFSFPGVVIGLKARILASWIPTLPTSVIGNTPLASEFNVISGTSMACPHASGVAALLKAAHPEWSPLAIGAGHVNPNGALDPGLVYDAAPRDYVNMLCGANYTRAQIAAITRVPPSAVDCSKPSADLNYPSFIVIFGPNATRGAAQQFSRTLTNVGALGTTASRWRPRGESTSRCGRRNWSSGRLFSS